MESTKSHQQKRGSLTPCSPAQTLWSSETGNSSSFKNIDRDHKGINVQVILRCRPLNEEEIGVKTSVSISCDELKREVAAIQNMGNKQIDKTFVFDKVFGATSKQKELYDQVVAPIVSDALQGYNCTIFAYGQTGTGKTYTMEGEGGKEENGEFDEDAGVIPRAVQQIFDTLEAQNAEYSMKVTFIELYNEEITDLLAPDEPSQFLDDRLKKSITLMEDGKGAVFMKGLEEQIVTTADEIYKILEKGCSRKHTAETLVNKQSNRSHSLLTITIQVKECSSDGVELIKFGKLNLVDLAGSENILRSGAREGRAREAGEINKSLLTLGRVITALVEHSGHVPYRDSKLTRLLRDSLGGKTKTCIIATVSPSIHSLEETLNTLDYAFRAKNIKNRPEVNQKVIKSAVIRDLYVEVNHLKQELHATREKNGIYIPHDRYQSEQASKKVMIEKLTQLELDAEAKDKQITNLEELFILQQKLTADLSEKLEKAEKELVLSRQAFSDLEDKFLQANETIKEKEYLIFNLLGSENALTERAFELHTELENATSEVSSLFDKIENKNYITVRNRVLIQSFQSQLAKHLEILHKMVTASVTQQEQRMNTVEQHAQSFVSEKEKTAEELRTRLTKLKDMFSSGMRTMVDLAGELDGTSQETFGNIKSEVSKQSSGLEEIISEISSRTDDILEHLLSKLKNQEQSIAAFAQQQQESHSRTYQTTQSVSRVTVNFFKTLITCVSELTRMVEEERATDEQKLSVLQKKFEKNADNEEKELIDKVTDLLANSKSRKKQLVQIELDKLRESAESRIAKLHQEMSGMQGLTFTTQEEWTSYLETTEKHYIEDTKTVESGKDGLTSILENSMKKARMDAEQWRQFQELLLNLQRRNIESADSIIKDAVEANKTIHSRLLSIASTALEESVSTQRSSLSSVDYLLRLDQDASEKVNSLMGLCHNDMKQMENAHTEKIVEITENAEKCLINEYMIDDPVLSTPRKLLFSFPSAASIDELRTPPFEELMESFRRTASRKQDEEDFDSSTGFHKAGQSLDSAFSLAATNGGRTQDLQGRQSDWAKPSLKSLLASMNAWMNKQKADS